MSDWSIEIGGRPYHPIPTSWIEHGVDESPNVDKRLRAVSAAGSNDGFTLLVRYADRRENVWTAEQDAVIREGRFVPRALADPIDEWARSKTASPRDASGKLRGPEINHFDTLWRDELERQRVAAGGGERRC